MVSAFWFWIGCVIRGTMYSIVVLKWSHLQCVEDANRLTPHSLRRWMASGLRMPPVLPSRSIAPRCGAMPGHRRRRWPGIAPPRGNRWCFRVNSRGHFRVGVRWLSPCWQVNKKWCLSSRPTPSRSDRRTRVRSDTGNWKRWTTPATLTVLRSGIEYLATLSVLKLGIINKLTYSGIRLLCLPISPCLVVVIPR